MSEGRLLVVDDSHQSSHLLSTLLTGWGYEVVVASSGEEALERLAEEAPDLVLLDIVLPGMDGHDVCRRLRQDPKSSMLPVVMMTGSPDQERVQSLEAGADDFVSKPFDYAELRARIQSLVRIKRYHDTVTAQAAELAAWNQELEARVNDQVRQLERFGRLRRFLSPPLAQAVLSSEDASLLAPHRRNIAVFFVELRGFTAFTATAEPEEVMEVLSQYHESVGQAVRRFEATVGALAGDGLLAYFNDPLPCPDPARRAVQMALAVRQDMVELIDWWQRAGHDLGYGIGIALGYATLGLIGFEGREEYGPVGTAVNLGSRLCALADQNEILIDQRTYAEVHELVEAEELPPVNVTGLDRRFLAYRVVAER